MHETRVLLSLIYRDYICTEDKRYELRKKDEETINEEERLLREKYNQDNIFKNKRTEKINSKEETKELAGYKEKTFIQKIFDKIKSIFKRK